MKTIDLKGSARSVTGKAAMKKIRREGNVPAVIYGHGEPAPVSVGFQALNKVLLSPETYLVNLDIDGKTTSAIVREAQFHPVTDHVLHVDFLRVGQDAPVEVELPIKLVGTCKGVLAGGKLVPMLRRLKVRGLISQLPAVIDIDISHLDLGKSIRVGEVNLEGIEIKSPASAGIAIVEIPRSVKTAEDGKK